MEQFLCLARSCTGEWCDEIQNLVVSLQVQNWHVRMSISIFHNPSERKTLVYCMFDGDLPVYAPMPHIVYRHSMKWVCSNDPDLNGDFCVDIHCRSSGEIERSQSRLDLLLLDKLSWNLLNHVGSFLKGGCMLFIKTFTGKLLVVWIPHRFASIWTIKLALMRHIPGFTVKQIMLVPVDHHVSTWFGGIMCNNDNIDDYWYPKPGKNPDIMHITLICRLRGLARTKLSYSSQARARNNESMKNVSDEQKQAASDVENNQDVKRHYSTSP